MRFDWPGEIKESWEELLVATDISTFWAEIIFFHPDNQIPWRHVTPAFIVHKINNNYSINLRLWT